MLKIAGRTAIGLFILLLMPLTVWISGWHWRPGGEGYGLYALFLLTETVTAPWGMLTSAILSGWFLWCLRFRLRPAVGLFCLLACVILLGQGVKSLLKERVQEPRPYVLWLAAQSQIDERQFYALSRKQRSQLVQEQLREQHLVPDWLGKHWAFETGFAFPSGHTLFVASWALLGVGLLWPRRHYKTVTLLMLWAAGVMGSRLVLGMHWPQDLVMASVIGWLLVTLGCWLAQRWFGPLTIPPQEQHEMAQRERE